jgi:hypothetical protein
MYLIVVVTTGDGEYFGHRTSSIRCESKQAADAIAAWLMKELNDEKYPKAWVKVFHDDPRQAT